MSEGRDEEEGVDETVGSGSTEFRLEFIEVSDKRVGILGGVNVTWSKCLRCRVLSSLSMMLSNLWPILLSTKPWLGRLLLPL